MTIIRQFALAFGILIITSCSLLDGTLDGSVFIVTRASESVKLGAVEVRIIAEKDFAAFLENMKPEIDKLRSEAESQYRSLLKDKAVAVQAYDQAKTALEKAQADYNQAQAAAKKAAKGQDDAITQANADFFQAIPSNDQAKAQNDATNQKANTAIAQANVLYEQAVKRATTVRDYAITQANETLARAKAERTRAGEAELQSAVAARRNINNDAITANFAIAQKHSEDSLRQANEIYRSTCDKAEKARDETINQWEVWRKQTVAAADKSNTNANEQTVAKATKIRDDVITQAKVTYGQAKAVVEKAFTTLDISDKASTAAENQVRVTSESIVEFKKLIHKWDETVAELYLCNLPPPVASVITDADGKFSVKIPRSGRFVVTATTHRMVAETEHYYWLIWTSLNRQKSKSIVISNQNLIDAGSLDRITLPSPPTLKN